MTEKLSIHELTTKDGAKIKYARILQINGNQVVGSSVMLHRLSSAQREKVKDQLLRRSYRGCFVRRVPVPYPHHYQVD